MAGQNISTENAPERVEISVAEQNINNDATARMLADANSHSLVLAAVAGYADTTILPQLNIDKTAVTDANDNATDVAERTEQNMQLVKAKLDSAKQIVSRKSTDKKPQDKEADIIVHKDGSIEANDNASADGGPVIVEFETDNSAAEMMMQQKAVVRDMIAYLKMNNPDATVPDEWTSVLATDLPPPVVRQRSVGGDTGGGGTMPGPPGMPGGMPSGGLRGGEGGGFSGSGGARQGSAMPSDVDRSGKQTFDVDRGGKLVDSPKLQDFIGRVVKGVSGNEGNFTSINLNDAGYGISIGCRQWNQKAGELPTLLKAWHEKNPEKFDQIFGKDSKNLLNEGWVRHANMAGDANLMSHIRTALGDKEFQDVQVDLARQFVVNSLELGAKYGLKSELGLALVADIVNQKGAGGAESALKAAGLRPGGTVTNEVQAVDRLAAVSNRPGAGTRYASLKREFDHSPADIVVA